MYNATTVGNEGDTESKSLSSDQMARWNKFIKFVKDKGYAGKAELDHDEGLRKRIFNEYNKANPDAMVTIDMVKPVQHEIQAYKSKALGTIKANPASYTGKPESFMPTISQVDGIFGQKTSQWAFPEAYIVDRNTGEKTLKGFAPKVDITALK